MNFNLSQHTVFITLFGSRLYGFANEDSDWDYRGIAIPPIGTFVGIKDAFDETKDSKLANKHFPMLKPDADIQITNLVKFARLASNCNPSILEIIFAPEDAIIHKNPIMDILLANKKMFLSRQVKARFCGYAYDQMQRMLLHKRWLDNPLTVKPLRSDYGLPDTEEFNNNIGAALSLIDKEVNSFIVSQQELPESTKIEMNLAMKDALKRTWTAIYPENHDKGLWNRLKWAFSKEPLIVPDYPIGPGKPFLRASEAIQESVAKELNFDSNFIELLRKERAFRTAKSEYDKYQTWVRQRNPKRAELERKFGADLKFVVHTLRLIQLCREILETGELHSRRPNAEELRRVRNGDAFLDGTWSLPKIIEFYESENKAMDELVKISPLPRVCPVDQIHEMVCEMVLKFNGLK